MRTLLTWRRSCIQPLISQEPVAELSSRFTLLLFEIRIHVYKNSAYNYTTQVSFYRPMRGYYYDRRGFPGRPALLQTCRRISDEAGPVFYANAYFRFIQNCGSILKVSSCGPIVSSATRHLQLDLDASSCDPALSFSNSLLGQPNDVRSVQINWADSCIPMVRKSAFGTPLLKFLARLRGLRV
jgi:hypothetical protein